MFQRLLLILSLMLTSAGLASAQEQVLQQVSVTGSRNLRPFSVKDRWEVRWDTKGMISIWIRSPKDGNPVAKAGSQDKAGSGSSFQPNGGEFYLSVTSDGDWTVTVVQLP